MEDKVEEVTCWLIIATFHFLVVLQNFSRTPKVMETNMSKDSVAGNISHNRRDGGAATCDRKYGSRLKKDTRITTGRLLPPTRANELWI